ncbi:flavodoxin family protein [Cerasicoccus maritimus]|uniref:flavodoxin family protein n=1 Tax=Cerasicoccus maritimus TaxID=490089 RepID=UPI0028524AEE|nr:flavodoxin family protein [Cerasicoccus maritimus]
MADILGIAGSPRKGESSEQALSILFDYISEIDDGLTSSEFKLSNKNVGPCDACGTCLSHPICRQKDDYLEALDHFRDPELKVVIVSTPVFFGSMSAQCKAFLDRGLLLKLHREEFTKVHYAVLAVGSHRHGGQELAIQCVSTALQCQGMAVLPNLNYGGLPGIGLWASEGESLRQDLVGLSELQVLARNIVEHIREPILTY